MASIDSTSRADDVRPAFQAASLAVVGAALCACASGPKPAPDLRLSAAYEAPANPSAASAASTPLERWWVAFDDPQLERLIDGALAANPDAKAAAARLREARAGWLEDVSRFLPQGGAAYSAGRTRTRQLSGATFDAPGLFIPGLPTSGLQDAFSANLDVSWEFDLFGRSLTTRRAADADVAAARFDYESARASLAAHAADAYFQAKGLAIRLADARETARIGRDLYLLADRRARAGLAPGSDADRAAGDLARAEAEVEALQAELQAQRRALLILAGRVYEPTASFEVPPGIARPPAIPASLPSDLLRRRPDVRSAEARLTGALGRRDLARLAFLPTFTLRPGLGWTRTVANGGELALSSWSLVGAVSQPILDLPKLTAQLRVQNARVAAAAAAYEKTLQTAFGEAEGALVRLEAERRRIAVLSEGEARARRAFEAARLGYARGLNDLPTALSAETAWRGAHAELTTAQVGAVRQAVAAFEAIGGGWPGAAAPQPRRGT